MRRYKPVIGLLGGIGSGKSTVGVAIAAHSGKVIAGDPVGHEALRQPELRERIAQRWPAAIVNGEVDRKVLGRTVFADPPQLKELEAIVFPWIRQRLEADIADARADPDVKIVVLDAAVMLEAGWDGVCDKVIFVDAPHEARVARVAGRGWSADDLDRRERSQVSLEEKRQRADAVIDNSGDVDQLSKQVDELLTRWKLKPNIARAE